MIKVVFDTNVLVSTLWSENGVCAKVVEMALRGEIVPYFNPDILGEYTEVLHRPKFGFQDMRVNELYDDVFACGRIIEAIGVDILLPDEDDRPFYEVAKAANAYLITGNLKHFPQEPFILSPADFLALINQK